jgi:hypothetical protein
MLESPELEFIMEAHNGLSAKIVQEAGEHFITEYRSYRGLRLKSDIFMYPLFHAAWQKMINCACSH